MIATLGNFATKLLTGSQAGSRRVRGTPQVHEIAGRTVFLLPLFHPGRGAADARRCSSTLREDFAQARRRCSSEPLPERERRRARAGREPAARADARADQLDLFG